LNRQLREAEPLHVQEVVMTRAARLCTLAGVTALAAMLAADASAQNCSDWLVRRCPDGASAQTTAKPAVRQEKQLARPRTSASSETGRRAKAKRADTAAKPKSQKARVSEPVRSAKAARDARSGAPSGNRNRDKDQNGEPSGRRLEVKLSDREKELLFQQFLEWEKGLRLGAEIDR
jgi:hypothetical protein